MHRLEARTLTLKNESFVEEPGVRGMRQESWAATRAADTWELKGAEL